MGAFNTLILHDGTHVQFKFGERSQYEYRLGDKIAFRDGQAGGTGHRAFSGIHRSKAKVFTFYRITLEDGVLVAANEIDELESNRLDRQNTDDD
jgi:hypothetical protein